MKGRIRQLRKALDLNQTEFGERIGIKQTTVAGYERGAREPLDSVILSICREFNVNEDWLRTGAGGDENMFVPEDMLYLQSVGKLGKEKNAFKKFYLNMMMKLPDEYWDYIYDEFKKFEKKQGE